VSSQADKGGPYKSTKKKVSAHGLSKDALTDSSKSNEEQQQNSTCRNHIGAGTQINNTRDNNKSRNTSTLDARTGTGNSSVDSKSNVHDRSSHGEC
jgi:hypothetical protein